MVKIKKCCVPGCEDKKSKRHRFPRANPELFKRWVKIVQPNNWEELTNDQIYVRCYVCHAHFADRYNLPEFKRGLTVDAIPTINVPGYAESVDSSTLSNVSEEKINVTEEILIPLTESEHDDIEADCDTKFPVTIATERLSVEVLKIENKETDCDSLSPETTAGERLSEEVQKIENKETDTRKSILKELNYTRKWQLQPNEKILYAMVRKCNVQISRLKHANKCLRARLTRAERLISAIDLQRFQIRNSNRWRYRRKNECGSVKN